MKSTLGTFSADLLLLTIPSFLSPTKCEHLQESCKHCCKLPEKYKEPVFFLYVRIYLLLRFNRVGTVKYSILFWADEIQSTTTQRWPTSSSDDNSEMHMPLYFKIHPSTSRKSSFFIFLGTALFTNFNFSNQMW